MKNYDDGFTELMVMPRDLDDEERHGFRELLKLVNGQRGYYETLMAWNKVRAERFRQPRGRQGDSNVLPGHGVMDIPHPLYLRYSMQWRGYRFMGAA